MSIKFDLISTSFDKTLNCSDSMSAFTVATNIIGKRIDDEEDQEQS
jgi:hypothetical protein